VTVALVGAGPGDPGLITVRGLELVRSCDALVYDVLVAPELVEEAPANAIVLPRERMKQHEVNELLITLAQDGLDVVRLKGGDPFVFGRGGEEAIALADAGIDFEVVPGVSAASAVPALAGIPLTHRGVSAQVTLVSGQSADGSDLDYEELARTSGTLVVFMGLAAIPRIARGLVDNGKDPETPAAIVARGTTPEAQVRRGALAELGELSRGLPSPALVVIGEVAALRLTRSPNVAATQLA
jgi:uroporphyrinogen III methyltransferase/synthase